MKRLEQLSLIFVFLFWLTVSNAAPVNDASGKFKSLLEEAERIPTDELWFEIIKLPNDIYAIFEPGHIEQVNSFLILGEKYNLLYDTGMGIGSIRAALSDLMKAEKLPDRNLIVVNSHAHLDHIGSNYEFDEIHAYDHQWRLKKLTIGIPGGNAQWIPYFADLTGTPKAPREFDPEIFSIPGIPRSNIKLFKDGHVFDLGNRKFKVTVSRSHTEESIILYDSENRLLFTGDVFVPGYFYVLDFNELENDLRMLTNLKVNYHYNTHGDQLIDLGLREKTLHAVEKINRGEIQPGEKEFLGAMRRVYEINDMYFWYMPEILMY